MDKAAFGHRLREARRECGLSSETLSASCAVNAVFIRQIECAARMPSLPTFVLIVNKLQISPAVLLADSLNTDGAETAFDTLWGRVQQLEPKQANMISAMSETIMNTIADKMVVPDDSPLDRYALGQRIQAVRQEQEITAEALSKICEKNPVFIQQIEQAKRLPSLVSLALICNKLNVSPDHLLVDSLSFGVESGYRATWQQLRRLTPKQLAMVSAMIETMISSIAEENKGSLSESDV